MQAFLKKHRWTILAAGAAIQILTGVPAAWGVFQGPVRAEYGFDEAGGILTLGGSFRGYTFCKRCVYENGAFTLLHTMPGVRFMARFRMLP